VKIWVALIALVMVVGALWVREALADCSTSTVCTTSYGRRVCHTESRCSAPRIRRCSFVTRCVPQRTCFSRGGMTTCMTRDVCRRVEICN
jgi:hypothetical protein